MIEVPGSTAESPSSSTAEFVSPPLEAPHPFNAIGFRWAVDVPDAALIAIDARVSADGREWSGWMPTEELDALQGGVVRDSDLLFAAGRHLQYRIAITGLRAGWEGSLDEVQVTYIDSTEGPTAESAAAASAPGPRLTAYAKPNVIGRPAWGANEAYRTWTPTYAAVKKIIVHHTATTTNPTDAAAAVRAIYYYHAVTQQWGDIGYNFLVDAAGRVYEGRFGGPGAIGAHALQYNRGSVGVALLGTFTTAPPTEAGLQAMQTLLVAQALENGIDPMGRGYFVDRDLPNIMGHRETASTACPGDQVAAILPQLKARVGAAMPALGDTWVAQTTADALPPSSTTSVKVTVKNTGASGWVSSGPNRIRLGYQWLTPNGAPFDERGLDLRTDLPRTVYPGQTITLNAGLRTPAQPGTYVLTWDLVQENVTWFRQQGNPPLQKQVVVAGAAAPPPSAPAPNDVPAPVTPPITEPMPAAAATLRQPVENGRVPLGPVFIWDNPPGTTQYHLQVIPFNDDGPGVNVIRNVDISYRVPEPRLGVGNYVMLPGMTYTWRVRTTTAETALDEDDDGWGPWASGSFRTQPTSSVPLRPFDPFEGSVSASLTPALIWDNPVQHIFYYEVQISSDPAFGTDAFLYWEFVHGGLTTPLNSYQVPERFPLQPGTRYFWRVRPRVQGDGEPLAWSQTWSFATAAIP